MLSDVSCLAMTQRSKKEQKLLEQGKRPVFRSEINLSDELSMHSASQLTEQVRLKQTVIVQSKMKHLVLLTVNR